MHRHILVEGGHWILAFSKALSMLTNQTILLQRRVQNNHGRQHVHTRSRIQIRADRG